MVIAATADGVSRVVADSVSVSFVTADVCIRCRADAVSLLLHLEPVLPPGVSVVLIAPCTSAQREHEWSEVDQLREVRKAAIND